MPELGGRRSFTATILIAIPILALILDALSWLRYGVDLPFLDDWTEYYTQSATSMAFSHLFAPGNDTIYPVGRALDVLAQKFLSGNGVAYQFISMIAVLGSLLFLQWKLLTQVTKDPLIRAAAFGLCVFMICPYTYWGLQNIAYVQALPTICILAILYVLVAPARNPALGILSICFAGLISGLSYISGAVTVLAVASATLAFAILNPRLREPTFIRYGIALLLVGLGTTAVQLGDIIFHQAGQLHRPDAHWVMPYEGDYWMFMLGKLGRALSLQSLPPRIALGIALCVAISLVAVFLLCFLALVRVKRANTPTFNWSIIYCLLFIAVFVYLNMISASRAKLRPDGIITSLDVFRFGFANRFHFFWITLLFPWLAVAAFGMLSRSVKLNHPGPVAAAISFLCIGLGYLGGVFGYASEYRGVSSLRSNEIECIQDKISRSVSIECPSVFPVNLSKSFVYARSIGASFTRYFPLRSYGAGDDASLPLLRLSTPGVGVSVENAAMRRSSIGDLEFVSKEDPQVYIAIPPSIQLSSCLIVQFSAVVRASTSDTAQLFYKTPDAVYFAEERSRTQPLPVTDGAFTRLTFNVESLSGFLGQFRFDVVQKSQDFAIRDLEIRCKLWN